VDEGQEAAAADPEGEPDLSTHAEVAPRSLFEPIRIAGVGIFMGAFALWIVLPPVVVRSIAAPLLIGAAGVALGAWAIRDGARRAGWGAVASGLIGMIGGVLITRASAGNLTAVVTWSTIVSLTLTFTTPLLFASLGGMFSERSGVVNIGLEGMMLMGAFFGAWGADKTNGWVGGLAIGILAGALLALVHAFFSIHLRTDQIISGTAINFLAFGITGYMFNDLWGGSGSVTGGVPSLPGVPTLSLGFLNSIPPQELGTFLHDSLAGISVLTLAAFALVPITYMVMFRTALGLRIRSCGEHPRAADTVGINVYAVRYGSVVASGAFAAAGGAFITIGYVHSFSEQITAGRGYIALAALIFGNWRPFGVLGATLMFGFASALSPQLENVDAWAIYGQLFAALPYLLTLIAVAGVIGRSIPPAAVGKPYKKQ
jgi:simple sugar transport system permease protein